MSGEDAPTGGYAMVPAWLMAQKPSRAALAVYVTLALRGTFHPGVGEYGDCHPSHSGVARAIGCDRSTVKRAIRELETLGALVRAARADDRGDQTSSSYRLIFGALVGPLPDVKSTGGVTHDPTPGVTHDPTPGSPMTPNPEPSYPEPIDPENDDSLRSSSVLASNETKLAARRRGTRLPAGWAPGESAIAWTAEHLRGTSVDPDRELDQFRDFWAAKAGENATKLDWTAAWRTWIRNAIDRTPSRNGHRPSTTDQRVAQAAEVAERFRRMETS